MDILVPCLVETVDIYIGISPLPPSLDCNQLIVIQGKHMMI